MSVVLKEGKNMKNKYRSGLLVLLFLFSFLPFFSLPGYCSSMTAMKMATSKAGTEQKEQTVQIPAQLDDQHINAFLAGLDDEQVRRLLIEELKRSAAAVSETEKRKLSGFTRIVAGVGEFSEALRKRLSEISSGARTAPEHLPQALTNLHGIGGPRGVALTFAALLSLFVAGAAAEWLFRVYIKNVRTRVRSMTPASWWGRVKDLALCSAIDLISIFVFIMANCLVFFIFYDKGQFAEFRRLIFVTYLTVVLLIRVIALVSQFIFAPSVSELRLLRLSDESAGYLHKCILGVSVVLGIGLLISAMLELQRVTQATLILVDAAAGLLVILAIIFILWGNRHALARMICRQGGEGADRKMLLRVQLAEYWHLLVIPYLIGIWGVWVLYLLVDRADLVFPILALMLSIPLYIFLDWIGQTTLSATLGLVHKPTAATDEGCEFETEDEVQILPKENEEAGKELEHVERLVPILRRCLSLSLAGIVFFWLLRLWGFDVGIGKEITHAAFKIVVVIILGYVIWKLAENSINRRLAKIEHLKPDEEEGEMGGAGGSRVGTLLKLLRKFLLFTLLTMVSMIILSAIGVNIGPLLAGAGIVGLAIGFGSQTLVKDIVSGVFFLVDDAFRLGDYVESGQVKGTVENISIRSLRLRHPRGMIYTVPYSHLGSVTNYSRDYIIMKLEFRVPYGTDINKVKKIIKKINEGIEQDEELGPKLLAPIKSQGVKELDDSGMIMRIKFKTKPGDQFGIRREIFSQLQNAFEKSGIQFAHRQVIVQLPQEKTPETAAAGEAGGVLPAPSSKQILSAGAAAAIAAALDEEEQQQKDSDKK